MLSREVWTDVLFFFFFMNFSEAAKNVQVFFSHFHASICSFIWPSIKTAVLYWVATVCWALQSGSRINNGLWFLSFVSVCLSLFQLCLCCSPPSVSLFLSLWSQLLWEQISQFLYLAKDLTIQSDVINVLIQQDKYSSVTHFLKKNKTLQENKFQGNNRERECS